MIYVILIILFVAAIVYYRNNVPHAKVEMRAVPVAESFVNTAPIDVADKSLEPSATVLPNKRLRQLIMPDDYDEGIGDFLPRRSCLTAGQKRMAPSQLVQKRSVEDCGCDVMFEPGQYYTPGYFVR